MLKKVLVSDLIDDGERLVKELDRVSFPVLAAFWLDLPESNYWRLVIASSKVDQEGPLAAYRTVQEVLGGLKTSALSLDDISVLSPKDQNYLMLRDLAVGPGRLGLGPVTQRVQRVVFGDAYIYRL